MAVAAALAGGGAYFFAKAQIEAKDFDHAITFINHDKDDYWCKQAGSRPIQDNADNWFCPISMTGYQGEEGRSQATGE